MVKKPELLARHKKLTKKDVEAHVKASKERKDKLTQDAAILEQNLVKFNLITDPLVDPETDTVLCWIRRPTQEEWEEMVPADLLEYRGKAMEEIPEDIWSEHKDFQFAMMAKLITNPKHDKDWWKAHSNLVFQQLFNLHLSAVLELLGISAENF